MKNLSQAGHLKKGDKVLITAAAGGAGHLAIQYAKAYGCHVIGTASTPEKIKVLQDLGCDRAIDYKRENLDEVLSKEYPEGVDVVWETIGGETFKILFNHLANKGRMILIGAITGYKTTGLIDSKIENMTAKMIMKSLTMTGFVLLSYGDKFGEYFKKQVDLYSGGKYKPIVDLGQRAPDGPYKGVPDIPKGVNYLHSGKSIGKVVVQVADP